MKKEPFKLVGCYLTQFGCQSVWEEWDSLEEAKEAMELDVEGYHYGIFHKGKKVHSCSKVE